MRTVEAPLFRVLRRGHELTLLISRLEKTVMNTSEYDALLYDDLPGYAWNEYFDASQYSYSIDVHNDQIFEEIKQDICDMLGIPLQRTGCEPYSVGKRRVPKDRP